MTGALYRIEHETRYVHSGGVSTSQHVAYLTPRTLPHQSVRWHELVIDPAPANRVQRIDYFGNTVDQFTILTPYDELRVVGRSVVEVIATESPIALDAGAPWEAVRDELFYRRGAPYADASEFSYPSPYAVTASELAAFARDSFAPERPLVAAAVHLMHRIHGEFTFDPGSTTIATPVTRVLADRRGVCQDFAHLAIACARAMGVAARYVSGYIETVPAPGKERVVGADASHAWFAVWDPDAGWMDFDPTNDQVGLERYITTAWGREYSDVTPIKGIIFGGGASHRAKVAVDVERVAG